MPRYLNDDQTAILRTARTVKRCRGGGQSPPQFAPGCSKLIWRGAQYVEYVGEAPLYQTGSPHCLACTALYFPEEFRAIARLARTKG